MFIILNFLILPSESLGPFRIVHDVQKTGRSPTIRVEAAKLQNFYLSNKRDLHDQTFLTALAGEPNSEEPFDRTLRITPQVETISFVIEGLPKEDRTSCMSTDLPYKVHRCEGPIRIRKIRDGE